ncbi:NAD(P)/FAD-dependent oxidoreductase [Olsenella sp. DSM 107455]|uniref:NAD(P)/FAD-dependent oxidoreductase n=1 Tax=Thermophilibacter gallinarum TaxID=2779357 RepID=A0ABR9QSS9_9ACTN|nr:NAD(P)/FAD-dependent oxidoreductase [Thermophilibacter gallinarum]
MPGRCDVCVVGGGAAGLAAAIAAAEAGASVVVLERAPECGRTILATGNGRCNLSNARLAWGRYNDPGFVEAVCGERFGADVLDFFEGCGLAVAEEGDGRLYPLSRQASSVREVLLARAERAGAVLAPAREVTGVERGGDGWRVTYGGVGSGTVAARSVVLSVGGGEGLLRSLGLACTPFEPVLCSLACEAPAGVSLDELDGRRAHATARLLRDGAEVARETGEVLFRPYGISGIAVFDLSRSARPGDVVSLDLTCGLEAERASRLFARAGGCAGLLDPVVARALGDSLETARDLRLVVLGPAEPERAQVTRGGLLTGQFDPATLGARDLPGLFACGEALDVDGACGGFNLAWAWKSGLVAGSAAASTP